MSVRQVSASAFNTARSDMNNLIASLNSVLRTNNGGSWTPSIPTLQPAISAMSRTVVQDTLVSAAHYSDTDGLVTIYKKLREYDSLRVYTAGAVWQYGQTIRAPEATGRRDAAFVDPNSSNPTLPAHLDLIRQTTSIKDILEVVTDGVAIHSNTIFVAPTTEYWVVNDCHGSCHGACHGSCHRNRR